MDKSFAGTAPAPGSPAAASVQPQRNGSVSGSGNGSPQMHLHAADASLPSTPDAAADVGKMFVGGLNWLTSSDSLKDYFSRFGPVKECVIMKTPLTRKSRGFGFVTFVDPADVNKVLQMAHHEVDGKKIDPKVAVPRRSPAGATKTPVVTRTKKAFIGGLPANTTPDDLRSYFSTFGTVEDAVLMIDKNTRRHRGFGFVHFASEETVDKVCDIHYHEINQKMVECKKAQPREVLAPAHLRNRANAGMGFVLPLHALTGRNAAAGAYLPFPPYDVGAAGYGRLGAGYPGFGMLPFFPGLPAYLGFYPPLGGGSPTDSGRLDSVSKRLEEMSLLEQLTSAALSGYTASAATSAASASASSARAAGASAASRERVPQAAGHSRSSPQNNQPTTGTAPHRTPSGADGLFGQSPSGGAYPAHAARGLQGKEPTGSLPPAGTRPAFGSQPNGPPANHGPVGTVGTAGHAHTLNHAHLNRVTLPGAASFASGYT
ncbi:RNA-binding protein Musashi homolog 2-like [Paramacrobiotus metropolitanus]|uniref:RNA-binding protein Musashi homolog 2-like n=1 Tax=Paramacrobiotus metropolitanus TaxID=2943436 RepID=UPI00244594CF|nr:RNA-binding protein Musashi homolog 2-like [Paramacrobiotus metropolitanus]